MYYRGAAAVLLVYEPNRGSFEKAKMWAKEIIATMDNQPVIVLIANKMDLKEDWEGKGGVDWWEVGKEYAKELGFIFRETSCLTGEGVLEVFEDIGRKLLELNDLLVFVSIIISCCAFDCLNLV